MSFSGVISEMKASKEPPSSNLRQMVTAMQMEEALQRLKAANASEDVLSIFPLLVKAHGTDFISRFTQTAQSRGKMPQFLADANCWWERPIQRLSCCFFRRRSYV